MPKVTIDDISIEVPAGTTILQAARMIGENVPPAMCYYSKIRRQWWQMPNLSGQGDKRFRKRSKANAKACGQLSYHSNGWYGS
jgi:hypothetical protein